MLENDELKIKTSKLNDENVTLSDDLNHARREINNINKNSQNLRSDTVEKYQLKTEKSKLEPSIKTFDDKFKDVPILKNIKVQ